MLEQPLFFTSCSRFLIQPLLTRSVRPHLVLFLSLCSTCVTYGTLCGSIGHQVICTNLLPRKAEDFASGGKYPNEGASAHIFKLFATSLIDNSGMVFKHVKIMNVFTCNKEFIKLSF